MIDIDISGWKHLLSAIKELNKQQERLIYSQTLRDGAKEYQKAVIEEAPEGETGQLKKGPKVKAMKRKAGRVGFSVKYTLEDGMKWYVNAIEYGAKHSGSSHNAVIPPNRFMTRAFDRITPGLEKKLPETMKQKLEQLATKLGKR
jgi:hypothetical protein